MRGLHALVLGVMVWSALGFGKVSDTLEIDSRAIPKECLASIVDQFLDDWLPEWIWYGPVVIDEGVQQKLHALIDRHIVTQGTVNLLRGRRYLRTHWRLLSNFVKSTNSDWTKVGKNSFHGRGQGVLFNVGRGRNHRDVHITFSPQTIELRMPFLDAEELSFMWQTCMKSWELDQPKAVTYTVNDKGEHSFNQIILTMPANAANIFFVEDVVKGLREPHPSIDRRRPVGVDTASRATFHFPDQSPISSSE